MSYRNLTPKQEAFAQAIVAGKTQLDAYRTSYDAAGSKVTTMSVKASGIMRQPNIRQRIDELRGKLEEKQLWTREKSVQALLIAFKMGSPGVKVAAVRELNLMHGFNAPLEANVNINNRFNSGVLMVPAPLSVEDWEKMVAERKALPLVEVLK